MEQLKTVALVIKSINWSETSKIITLLTREYGRIDVIAKGARKKASSFQGIIETLNIVEVIIHFSNRRELQILGKVSLEESFHKLRVDLKKTAYAYSIIELINIFFIHSQSEPVFFDFLLYILKFIEEDDKTELAFWYFILKLASFLGFRPQFERCFICGRGLKRGKIYFSFRNGAVFCGNCQKESVERQFTNSAMLNYFKSLQVTHFKNISMKKLPADNYNNYTQFLLEYLRYHTDQKLNLIGLTLLEMDA